jgi:competence protein ComEC
LLLTTGALLFFSIRKLETTALFFLLLLFLQTGIYAGHLSQTTPDSQDHIIKSIIEQEELIVLGKVRRIFSFDGESTRFDLDSISVRTAESNFKPSQGTIRYIIKERLPSSIFPGTTVAVRARLKRPHRFMTPGSFDYPAYLANKHIYVTGYISTPLHIATVETSPPSSQRTKYLPEILREKINRFIDVSLSGEQAAVYKALLTGDRSAISPSLIELFKGAGVLHILAISGMHMSLLGVFLFAVFFWLLRRSEWLILTINTKKTAAFLCIIPLFCYTLIAGANTPVLRSFIMSLIVILALCYGKRHSFLPLIACAALFILILSPGSLFSPSFQLSFVAVISIVAAIGPITKINRLITRGQARKPVAIAGTWIIAAMGVSLAATLGTAPLLLYHFYRISLVGIVANLIIEPLLCLWSLTLGFVAVIFIFIFPPAADLLLNIGGTGISLAIAAVAVFHSIPHSSIYLPAPSILLICLYYLSFLLVIARHRYPEKYRLPALLFPVVSLFFIACPPGEITRTFIKESTLAFLDVGHGSCSFIEMPGGRRLLIDGGAISSPEFNIGERVIAPYLYRRGIGTIDDIVVTHPDSDHYNGITYILKRFKVKTLWISTRDRQGAGWRNLLRAAAQENVEVKVPVSAAILQHSGKASLTVLANTSSPDASTSNDNGLILKYRHDGFSALFPGDISAEMEKRLVMDGLDLEAVVMLATHHGSVTSNSEEFVGSIRPKIMVVSSGTHKAYSFPAQSVLERCRNHNIAVLRTNTAGTITVTTKKGEYHIDTLLSSD